MKKIFFLTAIISVLVFNSCDHVKDEISKSAVKVDTNKVQYVRKVLLEDHTAHKCQNCPAAAKIADELKYDAPTNFGDRMVVIDVNGGMLAMPAGKYTYDFRCSVGNQLYGYFLPIHQPYGMINRIGFPSSDPLIYFYEPGTWRSTIGNLLNTPPDADIKISNDYTSSSRLLKTTIRSKFLTAQNGKYNLALYLTEDSIKAYQLVVSIDDSTYMHRFTLRDAINGKGTPWGDTLKYGSIHPGDSIVKTYNYILPLTFNGRPCDEKHCHIIACIIDNDPNSAKFREVMQVEDKKVIVK